MGEKRGCCRRNNPVSSQLSTVNGQRKPAKLALNNSKTSLAGHCFHNFKINLPKLISIGR
jgi:hypothetical protein